MSNMLNIGLQSLQAYQEALIVTSQNMGNVGNENYSRQVVSFTENMFYNGVSISNVERMFNETSAQNLQMCNSNYGMSNVQQQQMTELMQLVDANNKNSIGSYINDALQAIRNLNVSPEAGTSRSLFLQQLGILANRFNDVSSQMQLQAQNVNQSIKSVVNTVNQLTTQIASINQQITSSVSVDLHALLDQQETLIQTLAQYCNFTTQINADNTTDIMVMNGTMLVVGNDAYPMATVQSATNPNNLDLQLEAPIGTVTITNLITSGELGGFLTFMQTSLLPAQNTLDQLAVSMMYQFNTQNMLGIDANDAFGADIFVDVNDPIFLAGRVASNLNNTGNAQMNVTIDNATNLVASTYSLLFTSPTQYTLTRQSDSAVVSSGTISSLPQQINADGFTIDITSGTMNTNDQFTISPVAGMASNISVAISDPQQLALAWPVATAPGQNSGNGVCTVTGMTSISTGTFSTPGQLNPPILIQFTSPTTYQILNANTSAVIQSGIPYNPSSNNAVFPTPAPVGYDPGYRISISGVVNTNDTFTINFNTNCLGDNSNGKAMENLFAADLTQGGTLTFIEAYDNLSDTVSTDTDGVNIIYASHATLLEQSQVSYDAISSVDEVEEYINLSQYQEAYQASAQIIQVAKTIFDTIIGLGRS